MVKKSSVSLADALRDIAAAAPSLRAAGVTRVAVGDIAVHLAAVAPPAERPPEPPREIALGDLSAFRDEGAVS